MFAAGYPSTSRTHMLQWIYDTDAGLRGSPRSWVHGPAPSEKSRLQVHDSWELHTKRAGDLFAQQGAERTCRLNLGLRQKFQSPSGRV
jgi:hypothetical protein